MTEKQSTQAPMLLAGQNILVGVSGGIAAYKSPDLVRRLREAGANVRVVMTKGAKAFITPMTLQAVSGQPVHDDLLDPAAEAAMGHIELAKWADLIVIAPATANVIAGLAHGFADDLLATLCLATTAPIMVAPAMNQQMWAAKTVQTNVGLLQNWGYHIIEPASGSQACGDVGAGRMPEPIAIRDAIIELLAPQPTLLQGRQVVITAGPTREAIDPVRYLTNHSSGKMGFALAEQAQRMGAEVILVAGPTQLTTPAGVKRIDVVTAEDMLHAVQAHISKADMFIGCAAVADYRPVEVATKKLKKTKDEMTLSFVRNPDILATIATMPRAPFTIGFAAETNDVETYAQGKLKDKKLNMIAANDVSQSQIGFNSDENALQLFWFDEQGKLQHQVLAQASKLALARQLLSQAAQLLAAES